MNLVDTLKHSKRIEKKIELFQPSRQISHTEETRALIVEIELSLRDFAGSELLLNSPMSQDMRLGLQRCLAEKHLLPSQIMTLCLGQNSHFFTLFAQVLSNKQRYWLTDHVLSSLL